MTINIDLLTKTDKNMYYLHKAYNKHEFKIYEYKYEHLFICECGYSFKKVGLEKAKKLDLTEKDILKMLYVANIIVFNFEEGFNFLSFPEDLLFDKLKKYSWKDVLKHFPNLFKFFLERYIESFDIPDKIIIKNVDLDLNWSILKELIEMNKVDAIKQILLQQPQKIEKHNTPIDFIYDHFTVEEIKRLRPKRAFRNTVTIYVKEKVDGEKLNTIIETFRVKRVNILINK